MFYNDYMEMEITMKPNNSSGFCNENRRDNSIPGLIEISTHLQMGKQPKYSPQGGKQWQRGQAKQHCSLDFKQLEKD